MTSRRYRLAAASAVALFASTTAAHADAPLAEARWSCAIDASAKEACPTEDDLKKQISSRLGYDPFKDSASHSLDVHISRTLSGFEANITSQEGQTRPLVRHVETRGDSCDELAQSIVISVSLAVDPMTLTRPPPQTSPTPIKTSPEVHPVPPPVETTKPSPAKEPPPLLKSTPWHLDVEGGARVGFGIVPSVSLGPFAMIRARRSLLGLFAELGADLPLSDDADPRGGAGAVSAALLRAGAGACVLPRSFFACARFDGGALQGSGSGVATLGQATTGYASAALLAGVDVAVAGEFHLGARAEALAPITRTTLRLDDYPVWTTPALAGAFAVTAGYRF
ncbi:MAG: hypothetical protein ABI183_13730 [Polyangiaceae bacterium]